MYLATGSLIKVLIIVLSLPFSVVGGIWLIYFLGYNISLGVIVGIIALLGLDAETGVIMLLYQDIVYERYKEEGRLRTREDLLAAVREGALMRLRPKLMTVLATFCGAAAGHVGRGHRGRGGQTGRRPHGGRGDHLLYVGTVCLSGHLLPLEMAQRSQTPAI